MGTIIAVFNNKGGASKTTTSTNLSHAIAKNNRKVLLIDNDSQGDATDIMQIPNTITENTLKDIITNDKEIDECIYPSQYQNLDYIPNNGDTALVEPVLMSDYEKSLFIYRSKIRAFVKKNYDYILIDNPPSFGIFPLMALYMSDLVIVPNEAGSKKSLKGIKNATEFIEEIAASGNPDLKFLKILITKVDRRTTASVALTEYIRKTFTDEMVFKSEIPTNASIQTAESKDVTVIKLRSNVSGSKAYMKVADEVISLIEN